MRRPASGSACLPKAALINYDQHYGRVLVVKKQRFYSNCNGNYFKCNPSTNHCYEQMKKAKKKQPSRLLINTRTPKRAFFNYTLNATTICASFSLILSCAILFVAIHSSTITTVAAANLAPNKIDQNHNTDAPLYRQHHRQFGQLYSDGHHFNDHMIRRSIKDRSVLRHDQHHYSHRPKNNNNNNRHARHMRTIIGDYPINHEQSHRHPFHKLRHRSNIKLDSDSYSPVSSAQEHRHLSDDTTTRSHPIVRDLFRTDSSLNYFGKELTADSEIDSYNVDDVFNDKDDTDLELDSDDFENLDDDGDDLDDDDLDDDDLEDDDDDYHDGRVDRLGDIDDDNHIQIEPESRFKSNHVHGKNRDNSFDEQRARLDQHSNLHKFNRHPILLNDQVKRLISAKKSDELSESHRNRGQRHSIRQKHYHVRNNQLNKYSDDISNGRPSASINIMGSRHIKPSSPRVPYQSPIVVSISDNSYVSASPIVTKENTYDESTDYYSYNNTSDNLTTSTTATTTSNSNMRNINSYSGGSSLDLDNPIWRKPIVEIDHNEAAASTHFKVSSKQMQPAIDFSNFDRYHYNSDSESHETTIPPKLDRPEQQHDNKIEGLKDTTISDQSKMSDKIRTNMIASSPDVDGDIITENSDDIGATTLSPTSTTSMQASASDNDLNIDDDHNDDLDVKDIDDNDDSDGSVVSGASLDVSRHGSNLGTDMADVVHRSEEPTAKYSNIIMGPKNVLPSFGRGYWHNPHLASIQMVQEDPNELNQGGINSAIIAILFGIGATGMLIMVVGLKMRTIRERVACKGQRRSLVPDTDFLINTIPIRSDTFHSLDKQTYPQS